MIEADADIAVLGSGFAGSLTALLIHRIGLRPVLIDRTTHPQFAIGESSTPIANMVLRGLTQRYHLPRLAPLASYGSWQATYPGIVCGLKRGFSFFKHEAGKPFRPDDNHANELLVTANSDDVHSDTHWLRADVDSLFIEEVRAAGILVLDDTHIAELREASNGRWAIRGRRGPEPVGVTAGFLIDATGEGGLVLRRLGLTNRPDSVRTRSHALYTHFTKVKPCHELLRSLDVRVSDHPFCCDNAAQHHILDGAWLWILRFNNDVTSAGVVIDERRHGADSSVSPETEWSTWIARHPSLASLFSDAQVVQPPGALCRTGRLQRKAERVVGRNWALLPHTAGFVDPLYSTGIAHTLCGIERLIHIIATSWKRARLESDLQRYEQVVLSELALIDELVSGCYATFGQFRLLTAFSMLYFAAATTYEHRRLAAAGELNGSFLCANDEHFRRVARDVSGRLTALLESGDQSPRGIADFERGVTRMIKLFNVAGLCDPTVSNMYRYTATDSVRYRHDERDH